jgi:hypothetical protein
MWGKEEELKRAKMGIEDNWIRDIEIAKSQLMRLNERDEVVKAAEEELLKKGNFIPFLQLGSNGKDTILSRLDWSELPLKGCDLFLMSSNDDVLKVSDKTHLYLYKKDGTFFYQIGNVRYKLETELIHIILADEKFDQPAENPVKCKNEKICDVVLKQASKQSHTPLEKQRELLDHLLNPGHWLSISIKNCEVLKDEDLQLLIQKSPLLKKLEIINCPNLRFNFWDHIPKYDWSVKNIFLENLENIHYFGYTASVFEKCIELPNLEILHIKECIFLEEVYINAPLLKETHLRNIPRLRVLHTKSSMLENLHLTGNIGLSLLSEGHKIMNYKHIEKLNILKWETQDNQMKPAENLFNQFPILLFMDFQNIDNKIALKCIYHICQLFDIKKFQYLEITHASRRKIKTDTEKLFKHLVALEEIKSKIIDALIKTVDDSDSNVSKSTISLDSPVVCPTVSEIQTGIANFSIQGYAQKKETLKFFSRLMNFPEHPSYSIVQIKLLEIALTNTDLYLRVDALKYYWGSITLKIIQKLLNDSAWQIRKIAVKHLAASMIPDLPDIKERCELMISRLIDIDSDVREEIVRLLCQPKHRYAIDMIDDFLKTQTKEFPLILEVYIHIIWMMLGKSSQEHVQFLLKKGITYPDWQVQALTAESLGYAKHELTEVIKTMELLLTHEREYVQSKAKLGLKKLHQWVTEHIKKELDDYSIELLEKKPIILHNIPEGAYKETLLFFPSNTNKVSQIDSTETESLQIGLELPRAEINFLQ